MRNSFLLLFSIFSIACFGQFQSDPAPVTVCDGNSATFTVFYDDTDAGGVTFQWDIDGVTYSGPSGTISGMTYTNTSTNVFGQVWEVELAIDNLMTSISGDLVKAQETVSSDESSTAAITVNANPVVTAPSDVDVCEGEDAIFTANASGGSGTYSYVWTRYTGASTVDFDSGAGISAGNFNGTQLAASMAMTNSDIGVVITDGNSCTASTTPTDATLTVYEAPVGSKFRNLFRRQCYFDRDCNRGNNL